MSGQDPQTGALRARGFLGIECSDSVDFSTKGSGRSHFYIIVEEVGKGEEYWVV